MINDQDGVGLGRSCAGITEALVEGTGEKSVDDLDQPVGDAIHGLVKWVQLATHISRSPAHDGPNRRTAIGIQESVVERSNRDVATRFLRSRSDKRAIAGLNSELGGAHQVFDVCSVRSRFTIANYTVSRPS